MIVKTLFDGIIALVGCFLNYNPCVHAADAIVKLWKGVQTCTSVAGSLQRTRHIGKLLFSCPLTEQQSK